jgi:hypothetical protein
MTHDKTEEYVKIFNELESLKKRYEALFMQHEKTCDVAQRLQEEIQEWKAVVEALDSMRALSRNN